MQEKCNKKLIFIIIGLCLIIMVLGGYIVYDNFLTKDKDEIEQTQKLVDTEKDEEKQIQDNNINEKEECSEELTASKRYQLFLKNVENSLNNHFKEIPNVSDDELAKLNDKEYYSYGSTIVNVDSFQNGEEYTYSVWNNAKKLYLSKGNISKVIANNVLDFKVIETGNAGVHVIYYIDNIGNLYQVNYEVSLASTNWNFEIKKMDNLKNIVNIVQGQGGIVSGYSMALFIDIDGNIIDVEGNILN